MTLLNSNVQIVQFRCASVLFSSGFTYFNLVSFSHYFFSTWVGVGAMIFSFHDMIIWKITKQTIIFNTHRIGTWVLTSSGCEEIIKKLRDRLFEKRVQEIKANNNLGFEKDVYNEKLRKLWWTERFAWSKGIHLGYIWLEATASNCFFSAANEIFMCS